MCSYCRKIRDDKNYWQEVETYLSAHADVKFSHGICPTCWSNVVEPELTSAKKTLDAAKSHQHHGGS